MSALPTMRTQPSDSDHSPWMAALLGTVIALVSLVLLIVFVSHGSSGGFWANFLFGLGFFGLFTIMTSGLALVWMGIRKINGH